MANHVRGHISYLRDGVETGREWFERIDHPQTGASSLRAFCEMDDAALTRDVTYFLDAFSRPVDAFCRVTTGGAVKGTALFLSDDAGLHCEARMADLGRISQSLPLEEPAAYLGLHPLVGDALMAPLRGTSRRGEFVPVRGVTNSISPNGDQGLYAMPVAIDAAWLGREHVTVPAGTFDADRHALRWHEDWPPADLWVHGPRATFVQMTWDMVGARYELTEISGNT
ncbi:hypothetical protein [Novosphingobium sp. AP12]|uniref:hypothetical protein n=1 Tax=Novosphingobium sp. AP12 TaxID=1144305 RepID=UPI0002720A58|nr:hypothetical protein [Novosphingobium sp. AP12]EJL33983.1 hypothetical protein PMI02_00866 [Novosphingobium sp. AP12]